LPLQPIPHYRCSFISALCLPSPNSDPHLSQTLLHVYQLFGRNPCLHGQQASLFLYHPGNLNKTRIIKPVSILNLLSLSLQYYFFLYLYYFAAETVTYILDQMIYNSGSRNWITNIFQDRMEDIILIHVLATPAWSDTSHGERHKSPPLRLTL
jgi:hypothetical protein